MKMKMIKSYH